MIRRAAVTLALALSACATGSGPERDLNDPGVQQLLDLPVPDYFATVSLAADLARNCARYRYDAELDSAINAVRNNADRGSRAALTMRDAIVAQTAISARDFTASYGLTALDGDLCRIADAEMRKASAIAALLVPV